MEIHIYNFPCQKSTSQDTNIQLTKKALYAKGQFYRDRYVLSPKDRPVTGLLTVPLATKEVTVALGLTVPLVPPTWIWHFFQEIFGEERTASLGTTTLFRSRYRKPYSKCKTTEVKTNLKIQSIYNFKSPALEKTLVKRMCTRSTHISQLWVKLKWFFIEKYFFSF